MTTTTIDNSHLVGFLVQHFGENRMFEIQPSNTEVGYITDLELLELLEYIHNTLVKLYDNTRYFPNFVYESYWKWLSISGHLKFDLGNYTHNYGDNLIPLVHKDGKLLKRIRAALKGTNDMKMRICDSVTGYWGEYIPLKVEIPNNVMGLWGDKLKEIVARNNSFRCAIETDLIDGWNPGDFGDSGSCYWDSNMYEKARYALAEYSGAFALKFYDDQMFGEGRAWVVPHPEIPNALVMFNVYPRSNSKYTYNSTGTVLAHILQSVMPDTTYQCTKTNMDDMEGILYINNDCLVVHPTDASNPTKSVKLYDLKVPEYYHAKSYAYCYDCNNQIDEDETYSDENGNDFCEDCYSSRYCSCEYCSDETRRSDAINIDGDLYCEHCVDAHFVLCDHCESYVNSDDYNTTTNMCDSCTSDNFTECEICGTYIADDEILNDIKSFADGFTYCVCQDCHDNHTCNSCGRFNYSSNRRVSGECMHCPTLEGIG